MLKHEKMPRPLDPVDKLIADLRARGELTGREGQFIIYDKGGRLFKIVPRDKVGHAAAECDSAKGSGGFGGAAEIVAEHE